MRSDALVLLALLVAGSARAAPDPASLAWQPHPGAAVPLGQRFVDETGRGVTLREFSGAPMVLALGYFQCPTLCGPVRGDVVAALAGTGLVAGRDYRLMVMSIDPKETPSEAQAAKRADLAQAGAGADGRDWHYLSGDAQAVALTVGFPYVWDEQLRQFAHPAGVAVLTSTGLVSRYLEGVGYTGAAMRAALSEAEAGVVAAEPSPILLLCFHYDAATGRYTLAIEKVLKVMAAMTVLGIAGLFALLHRKRRAQRTTGSTFLR